MYLKKFICIIMSFKIKRHNITRVISRWVRLKSKQKHENIQIEAYSLFWSHFFRCAKNHNENRDIFDAITNLII